MGQFPSMSESVLESDNAPISELGTEPVQSRPQFRFTKENARECALRGAQAKRDKQAKLIALAEQGRIIVPQTEALTKQLNRIMDMIGITKDIDRMEKLTAIHTRLFNSYMALNNQKRRKRGSDSGQALAVEPLQT